MTLEEELGITKAELKVCLSLNAFETVLRIVTGLFCHLDHP